MKRPCFARNLQTVAVYPCASYLEGGEFLAICVPNIGGLGKAYAWRYLDEVWDGDLGPSGGSVPTVVDTSGVGPFNGVIKIPGQPAVVFQSLRDDGSFARELLKWNYSTDTWTSLALINADWAGIIAVGGRIYWPYIDSGSLYIGSCTYDLGGLLLPDGSGLAVTVDTSTGWAIAESPSGSDIDVLAKVGSTRNVYRFNGSSLSQVSGSTFPAITSSYNAGFSNISGYGTPIMTSGSISYLMVDGASATEVFSEESGSFSLRIAAENSYMIVGGSSSTFDRAIIARFNPSLVTPSMLNDSSCIPEGQDELSIFRTADNHAGYSPTNFFNNA